MISVEPEVVTAAPAAADAAAAAHDRTTTSPSWRGGRLRLCDLTAAAWQVFVLLLVQLKSGMNDVRDSGLNSDSKFIFLQIFLSKSLSIFNSQRV